MRPAVDIPEAWKETGSWKTAQPQPADSKHPWWEVEDNLFTLRVLDGEARLPDEAVQASQLAERPVLAQYRAGSANDLALVTAQKLSPANQRTAAQLLGRQLAASVSLITATGGGWNAPTTESSKPAP